MLARDNGISAPMRLRLLPPALAGLALAAATLPAWAGDIVLSVSHTRRLALAGSAGSVVVGDPKVADATVVDSRTVFVSGRGPGATDITVLDPLGRTLFAGEVKVLAGSGVRVSIYRGPTRSDLACDPRCQPNVAAATPEAAGAGAAGAAGPETAAPLPGLLSGAVTASAVGARPS